MAWAEKPERAPRALPATSVTSVPVPRDRAAGPNSPGARLEALAHSVTTPGWEHLACKAGSTPGDCV